MILSWIILVLLIGAVLAAETINTTIENLVDMYTKEYDEEFYNILVNNKEYKVIKIIDKNPFIFFSLIIFFI